MITLYTLENPAYPVQPCNCNPAMSAWSKSGPYKYLNFNMENPIPLPMDIQHTQKCQTLDPFEDPIHYVI